MPPLQVNSQLQTSNPDVYAVGDIAAFPLTMYGDQLNRQEHVANARWAGGPLVVLLHLESRLGSKACMKAKLKTRCCTYASTLCRADRHPGLGVVHRHGSCCAMSLQCWGGSANAMLL